MTDINIMETMLSDGQDNALIRFTMGSAFIKHRKFNEAAEQLAGQGRGTGTRLFSGMEVVR